MRTALGALLALWATQTFATPKERIQSHPIEAGIASIFSDRLVACPPYRIDPYRVFGAAHRTLPCGTKVEVTNRLNGRKALVTIVDIGPCASPQCRRSSPRLRARIFDMLPMVAKALGAGGLTPVSIQVR